MFNLKEELNKLPEKPGVYLMKDKDEQIIYVGKAKVLKNRVRQYFQNSTLHGPKIEQMVKNVASFEIIITNTELEALILECNLIKQHKPKYNSLLKDDKHYPYIRASVNEEYPKITVTRSVKKDKAKYYGPFSSMIAVKETVEMCGKLFKLRTCHRSLPRDIGKKRPCLNYHIGRCAAPCDGLISKEQYAEKIKEALLLLDGKHTDIISKLKNDMDLASEAMEFEKAAEIRDKINSIRAVFEKQKIDDNAGDDRDVIGFDRTAGDAVIQIFFIRNGKMIGREHFMLVNTEDLSNTQLMAEFLKQFYAGGAFIPKEIVTSCEAEDIAVISQWLSEIRGKKTSIITPIRGEKLKLAELACENARQALEYRGEQIKREYQRAKGAIKEIQEALGLEEELKRVEAFDISNIHGFESVGSMVVFEEGKPKRSDYRKFRIKWVKGANDYASMMEVLERRLNHGLKEIEELKEKGVSLEEGKFTKLPDIIMVDGGKIQEKAALEAMSRLGVSIPVCGMIKDDNHRTRGIIYKGKEITLKTSSEGFKLLTRIQDEVHRFSIEYHRKVRSKSQFQSELDEIEGVGDKRRKALIKHFADIDAIRKASLEEISSISGIDKKTASNIYNYFHN